MAAEIIDWYRQRQLATDGGGSVVGMFDRDTVIVGSALGACMMERRRMPELGEGVEWSGS